MWHLWNSSSFCCIRACVYLPRFPNSFCSRIFPNSFRSRFHSCCSCRFECPSMLYLIRFLLGDLRLRFLLIIFGSIHLFLFHCLLAMQNRQRDSCLTDSLNCSLLFWLFQNCFLPSFQECFQDFSWHHHFYPWVAYLNSAWIRSNFANFGDQMPLHLGAATSDSICRELFSWEFALCCSLREPCRCWKCHQSHPLLCWWSQHLGSCWCVENRHPASDWSFCSGSQVHFCFAFVCACRIDEVASGRRPYRPTRPFWNGSNQWCCFCFCDASFIS